MVKRHGENEDKVDQSVLGEPITLPFSGQVAKTRFMKAAMTERMSSWDQKDPTKRGVPSKELIHLYKLWGEDAYGIVLSGNIIVDSVNLEAPGNPIVSRDSMVPGKMEAFKEMIEAAQAKGSIYSAQLSHGGRQVVSFLNPHPVSASDVKLDDRMGMSFGKPEPLSQEGIQKVIDSFAFAAHELYKVGCKSFQLHAAHGYLLAQFISPTTNKRTDKYGGSLENRSRIIFEIFDEIKKRVNDDTVSLGIKLNSVEFQEGGFTAEDAALVCEQLEKAGIDFIELSGGTYQELGFSHKRDSTKKREGFFLEFADMIRPKLKKTVIYVTGGFRSGRAMVEAVKSGSTQGIGLARPVCNEYKLCEELIQNKVPGCIQPLIDEGDFGATLMLAGISMKQASRGEKPYDPSNESDIESFQKTVGEYQAQQKEQFEKGVVSAGYPVVAAH